MNDFKAEIVKAVEKYEGLLCIKSGVSEWNFNGAMESFRSSPTKENFVAMVTASVELMQITEKIADALGVVKSYQLAAKINEQPR